MTQKIPFEPFSVWKDMYEHTEKAWSDIIQDTLGKEVFSEGLGQIQAGYLQYQETVNNLTEAYFKQANIPTRDEIANVASLVINVENKVDGLEDLLDENRTSVAQEINHLKRSVTSLDKKLDKILEAISVLDKKIVQNKPSNATPVDETKAPRVTPANSNTKK